MKKIRNEANRLLYLVIAGLLIAATSCKKDDGIKHSSAIYGKAFDAITFENLSDGLITVEYTRANKTAVYFTQEVDVNGKFHFKDIPKAVYNLKIVKNGYKTMFTNNLDISQDNAFIAFLPASNTLTTPIGGISGVVKGPTGEAIANANIAISAQDESITNGYFSSATSNQLGEYYIGAIPLHTTSEFKVRCVAEGYAQEIYFNVIIQPNEMVSLNFRLQTAAPAARLLAEGFESTENTWESTGYWNICSTLPNANVLWPEYVKLAPNDLSEAKLPSPFKGNKMAWYGNPSTCNYLGEQSQYDNELSGGTSNLKNSGTLTSPVIQLTGLNEASLNFWTWFEIESVNPNKLGYDLMEIYVIDATGKIILLGKLNPYTDPIITARKALPFTSGGFNQAPVWKYHEFDLTPWAGSPIRIRFSFDTRDALFNGFRGWFVDEIKVVDKAVITTKSSEIESLQPLMERSPF